jgi:hypothetical protein
MLLNGDRQPEKKDYFRACHHLSEKDGFFWMLRRETGKKRSIYRTYIDCFLAGSAAQHTGKDAFEQMMTRPKDP